MQKRILSVYYSYTGDKEVPQIRLQGKWLKELGFEIGKKIVVLAKNGVLVIRIASAENNVSLVKKDNNKVSKKSC
ncbi:MAG: toxic protein SymE [Thermoanaerobacterium sp.]|nr:toxic protein SymE [Thermoanaerobacterium sp.]